MDTLIGIALNLSTALRSVDILSKLVLPVSTIYVCILYICIYVCIFVGIFVCMHICMYICVYFCMYIMYCLQFFSLMSSSLQGIDLLPSWFNLFQSILFF